MLNFASMVGPGAIGRRPIDRLAEGEEMPPLFGAGLGGDELLIALPSEFRLILGDEVEERIAPDRRRRARARRDGYRVAVDADRERAGRDRQRPESDEQTSQHGFGAHTFLTCHPGDSSPHVAQYNHMRPPDVRITG
jgi:hypothetical protein